MRVLAALACALVLVCAGLRPGHAEKRLALVIGNDRYANLPANEQLRKAVNDARAVGDALESIGFQVIRGENLGRPALGQRFHGSNHIRRPRPACRTTCGRRDAD